MTTTDSSRTSGRIPDLRYQEAENDLRAAVRDLPVPMAVGAGQDRIR